jgi:gluconate kinase
MSGGEAEGVLITGVYGAGKSTVAEEIADSLEARGARFGAVDLDWLMWFGVPGVEPEDLRRVYLANLAAVVANYRDAGVVRFVLAGAVRDREEVRELEAAAGLPLRVVRLVVSREQVDHRLENDPTSGRHGDLEVAREWLAGRVGEGIEDRAVTNDGPIAAVASEILDWLSW